jgi:cyclopropane fatty-acyl-phospholipid synthase-like methyltransferase
LEVVTSAAAERNKQPIAEQLLTLLPTVGKVLEIASGTGQHVVHFAAQMPGLTWQPTDCADSGLPQLRASCSLANLPNIAAPVPLDVLQRDWRLPQDFAALVCINMIHISPWETTAALFAGAARHLLANGGAVVVLYGPFRERGQHTAPSNETFDAWLKAKDPRFGVRDLEDVEAIALAAGFHRAHLARLPANNLLLAFRRDN